MKSKLEKIEELLLRSQNPAALHEVQQLIEDCGDLAAKARLAPMLYEQNQKLKEQIEVLEASNLIKTGNIKTLEKELAELKLHKEYDQALDALIAERDKLKDGIKAIVKTVKPIDFEYQVLAMSAHEIINHVNELTGEDNESA